MKRLKSIWTTLIIVILSVVMILGVSGITAFGANFSSTDVIQDVTSFYSKFEYGKEYSIQGNPTITTPNGSIATLNAGKLKADQVGAYTIGYGDYSYTVKCVTDKEYELRVSNGGADIATFMQVNGTLTVPTAGIYFKNDDGNYEKLEDSATTVYAEVEGLANSKKLADTEQKYSMPNAGTFSVIYSANIAGGTKFISTSYTVKVLTKYSDTIKPSINVVNVPTELSLKTKVTLPTATATDNSDTSVKVVVEVTQFDSATNSYVPVKEVTVDDNGYAAEAKESNVVFDNKHNVSFYPMAKTDYRIVYTAYDDNGNKSNPHSYTASCIDKTAPILKDIADNQIPSKWATDTITYAVKDGETDGENVISAKEDLNITFPVPEYVDNSGEKASVSFEIKDTVNNQIVAKIANINGKDGANEYKYSENNKANGVLQKDLVFAETGLVFNFNDYIAQFANDGKTYTGTYTITYKASDARPNNSVKSYDIVLEKDLVDESAPDAKVSFNDEYLVVTDSAEDFTIPTLTSSDDTDTRPTIKYELISGTNRITVDGGEKATLQVTKNGSEATAKPYLIVEKSKTEKVYLDLTAGELKYNISVKDDATNETVLTNDTAISILNAADFANWANVVVADFAGVIKPDKLVANSTVEVGEFKLAVSEEKRDFVGFEMYMTNEKNELIKKRLTFTTFYDKAAEEYQIKDIQFVPEKSGEYNLFVRVFDVTGRSIAKKFVFTIDPKPGSGDGGNMSAENVPVTGSVYTTYQLKNRTVSIPEDVNPDKKYVVRNVTADGKFSMMGSKFTAYTAATYKFNDGYYNTSDEFVSFNENNAYSLTVTETSTPVWQLQGKMPTYTAKAVEATDNDSNANSVKVVLPKMTAVADYFNAKIELTAKSHTGNMSVAKDRSASEMKKDIKIDADGNYYFYPYVEGTYTLTYVASYGSGKSITTSYEIKAGDTVAPTFKADTEHDTRAVEGGKFRFSSVTVESAEDLVDDVKKDVRYVKRLKAPDNTVVYEIDEKGENGRTRQLKNDEEYVFDTTGVYKVEYVVYDKANNDSIMTFEISVSAERTSNPISMKIVSTVLIIVGALLIAGVILYFIRFRKVKVNK